MKMHFAKYLPVEGEIKEGDNITNKNKLFTPTIWTADKADVNKDNIEKVKLFLCSRDIQVGDKCKFVSEDGRVFNSLLEGEDNINFVDRFKVIGEISPEAKWVKEGDEFLGPEAGVKCEVFPIHDHDDETEEMIFTDKYGKKVDTPIYLIKGPCGHFH